MSQMLENMPDESESRSFKCSPGYYTDNIHKKQLSRLLDLNKFEVYALQYQLNGITSPMISQPPI